MTEPATTWTEIAPATARRPNTPAPEGPRVTRDHQRESWARAVAVIRAGVGVFCLFAPRRALVRSERDSAAARRVMRVLGARHLTQASVEIARPVPVVLKLGAGVDAIHALSCLGFAVLGDARWRHGVLVNALAALIFCGATAATARRRYPDHDRPQSGGVGGGESS